MASLRHVREIDVPLPCLSHSGGGGGGPSDVGPSQSDLAWAEWFSRVVGGWLVGCCDTLLQHKQRAYLLTNQTTKKTFHFTKLFHCSAKTKTVYHCGWRQYIRGRFHEFTAAAVAASAFRCLRGCVHGEFKVERCLDRPTDRSPIWWWAILVGRDPVH